MRSKTEIKYKLLIFCNNKAKCKVLITFSCTITKKAKHQFFGTYC